MNNDEKAVNSGALPISQLEPAKVQCCPECGGKRLMRDYECAEIVCMDCGFVIAAKIADRGPEWRAFDNEQRAKARANVVSQ